MEQNNKLNTLKLFAREVLNDDTIDDMTMRKAQLNGLIELIKDYPTELINLIQQMISNIDKEMRALGLCVECGAELEDDCSKTDIDITFKNGKYCQKVIITKVCPKCGRTETREYIF